MKDYVFISYSSKNNVKAKNFRRVLEENGIACWRAPESIEAGANYAKSIPSAIKNCGVMVVLISRESQASEWVPKEIDLAINQQKPILPIYIENCDLIEPFDLYLSNVQAVKLFTQRREAIRQIVERICAVMPQCAEKERAAADSEALLPSEEKPIVCPFKIAVIGVGGCGVSIVSQLSKRKTGVHKYIALDCDKNTISRASADIKLLIDSEHKDDNPRSPENAERAIAGNAMKINDAISDSDWVFVVAGLGGGMGSGGAPKVAELARGMGKLSVMFVTMPFDFEGEDRRKNAQFGATHIYEAAHSVVKIRQDNIPKRVADSVPFKTAMSYMDGVVQKSILALLDTVCSNGLINIDSSDFAVLLKDGGDVMIGVGEVRGINRDIEAANLAVSYGLLGAEINDAKNAIINVSSSDISLDEAQHIIELVRGSCKNDSNIALGVGILPELGDILRVTVIAGMGKEKQAKRKRYENYMAPPTDILKNYQCVAPDEDDLKRTADTLENTVGQILNTKVKVVNIIPSVSVTRYELECPSGTPIKKLEAHGADIQYDLAAVGPVRIEAPIPGKRAIGIEVPNAQKSIVGLREIVESDKYQKAKSPMTFAVGKDINGDAVVCNLEKVPHFLVAGQTGSGKSAFINSLIVSLLYKASPEYMRFILIDPKRVAFSAYAGMPHLLFNGIINEPDEALSALDWAVNEMERRYALLSKHKCNHISMFNESEGVVSGKVDRLPHIVIIIDELADLMDSSVRCDIEDKIKRLTAIARASGIHIIVATQRPSVKVITGTIKANLTSRVAFKVISSTDSRIILDATGAESLVGNGDMLYFPTEYISPKRVQGAFISDEEVASVLTYVKDHVECDFAESVAQAVFGHRLDKKLDTSFFSRLIDKTKRK